MSPRMLASLLAAGRIGFGAGIIAQPERFTGPWLGREGRHPGARVLGRAVGARDLGLGAGAISCSDEQLQTWLVVGLAADATDLVATLAAGSALPLRGRAAVAMAALSGVAMGAAALVALNR